MRTRMQGAKRLHFFENIEKLDVYYHILTISLGYITVKLSI